jgi:hypothetical protein
MSISCSCGDWDGDGWVYTYAEPLDFKPLATKRAHRCCSCKRLVRPGEDIVELERYRYPRNDIEERIYGEGDEVPLASWVLCEECGGLFMAIRDLGVCWVAGTNIKEDVREWAAESRLIRAQQMKEKP